MQALLSSVRYSTRLLRNSVLTLIILIATPRAIAAQSAPHPLRIVALGDSITAGLGLDPDQAYPALLDQKLKSAGYQGAVVNAGISGDTSSNGLQRLDWVLHDGADVLIIALGSNDGLRGLPPAETERNLVAIIDNARAKLPAVKLLLAGTLAPPNMGDRYTSEFRALFPRIAAEKKTSLVPFFLEGVAGRPELNQADGIHPTAAGQQRVADLIWLTLEPMLKEAK